MCIVSSIMFYIFVGFVCWNISYGNFSSCSGYIDTAADSDGCCGLGGVAATKYNNLFELLQLKFSNKTHPCTACQGNLLSSTTYGKWGENLLMWILYMHKEETIHNLILKVVDAQFIGGSRSVESAPFPSWIFTFWKNC